MITFNNNKVKLDFIIEGYAYPFAKDDWDANWLQLKIVLHDFVNNEKYENSDSCLLTMELLDLKNWFVKIKEGKMVTGDIKFIEPNIAFEINENELKIILKYGFNPAIDFEKTNQSELAAPYTLIFEKDKINISKIITLLEELILKFPKKKDPK